MTKDIFPIVLAIIIAISVGSYFIIQSHGQTAKQKDANTVTNNQQNTSTIKNTNTSTSTEAPATAPVETSQIKSGYTLSDISMHGSEDNCWLAINDGVYDITDYIAHSRHKAGMDIVIAQCGTNATNIFDKEHRGQKAYNELAGYYIGALTQ